MVGGAKGRMGVAARIWAVEAASLRPPCLGGMDLGPRPLARMAYSVLQSAVGRLFWVIVGLKALWVDWQLTG